MRILVGIDDTDQPKQEGVVVIATGQLASQIAEEIEARGWGTCEPVSRHQLFVHPDVPYTSHNSAMCFAADIQSERLQDIIAFASDFLKTKHAPGSDPGLCVVEVDSVTKPAWLIGFGYMAKNVVWTKDDAYGLAEMMGIHLSEHGGTGDGVIGALAGTGLRLCGNDGRVRGRIEFKAPKGYLSIAEMHTQTTIIEQVRCINTGRFLDDSELVHIGEVVKPVMMNGKRVLLVYPRSTEGNDVPWQTCSKEQIKAY